MPSESKPLKLSELTYLIGHRLQQAFGNDQFWVVAEISSLNYYPNRDRHYFDFVEKDPDGDDILVRIKGIAWKRGSDSIMEFERVTGQRFSNGIQVLVRVSVSFHSLYGLSLTLQQISSEYTLGAIERHKQMVLKMLLEKNPDAIRIEGDEYVTVNKLAALSRVIQKIAIIGSPNSEGYKDFIHTLDQNQYGYQFSKDLYHSSVQGSEAAKEMIDRLIMIFNSGVRYDCVVIIRGGGAQTDFQVFNQFNISQAVARFPFPIITGIGHVSDVSIVDMMVHQSMNAPTKVAEFIVSHNRTFEENLARIQEGLVIRTQQYVTSKKNSLRSVFNLFSQASNDIVDSHRNNLFQQKSRILDSSRLLINSSMRKLDRVASSMTTKPGESIKRNTVDIERISTSISRDSLLLLRNRKVSLDGIQSLVRMAGPESILNRGFAIIARDDHYIADGNEIEEGSEVKIILKSHEFDSRIVSKRDRK